MTNTARFRRAAAAGGLLLTALLMIVSTVLAPEFPSGYEERLAAIDVAGWAGTASALAFTLAQLPLIAGALGVGHLLRGRAPLAANLGTSLVVLGAFGHSVFGGVSMVMLSMARDVENRAAHAAVLAALESGPGVAFMAMGLLGTVAGLLVLAVGVLRAGVGPRWVGPALIAFLVVEFALSSVSEWASLLAVALYTLSLGGLAWHVRRTPAELWETARAGDPADDALLGA